MVRRRSYPTIMTWHDFPYINNQSMTMDEQTLVKTLCQVETGMVPQCLTAVFKEKEPKITKARGYFKLTIPMRLFQVATEKNIADSLFPYVKHQSMTMDEQTLVNTLCLLTAKSSQRGDKVQLPELRLSAFVSQDISDRKIYHVSAERPSKRYWKKLFFNLIDMALLNSYELYKSNTDGHQCKSRHDSVMQSLLCHRGSCYGSCATCTAPGRTPWTWSPARQTRT